MGNTLAYIALVLWPIVGLFSYRHFSVVTATVITIVGGYLFLPVRVAIDFPLIPPLDKESIPAITALLGLWLFKKRIALLPKQGLEKTLIIILLAAQVITVMTNGEVVYTDDGFKRGLVMHDALSAIINQYLTVLPFIIGMQVVKTPGDLLQFFKLLMLAGLVYTPFILFEIRMSPQLHTWIYGFFPHSFGQQIRFEGFRAVVFLGHGMLVAMFVAISLAAAALMWRLKIRTPPVPVVFIVLALLAVLVLQKTVGALFLGLLLFTAIAFLPAKMIRWGAMALMLVVIGYPLLTKLSLFPHEDLVNLSAAINTDRAESLAFRFYHENRLLEHALDKWLFGWGGWGRNRLATSVTDGYWIITFGMLGLVGFLALFGLALAAVGRGLRAVKRVDAKTRVLLSAHTLIVAVVMVDQIPNASLGYSWLWLLIGALSGAASAAVASYATKKPPQGPG